MQLTFHIPLIQQHLRSPLIQQRPIPRQLLISIQNRHHRQQQRIPRQLPNRLRLPNRFLQPSLLSLPLCPLPLRKRQPMPPLQKILNLFIIQILQHIVRKLRLPQSLRLISQPPRSHHHLHRLIAIAKPMNIRHHRLPQLRIKHLIHPIK